MKTARLLLLNLLTTIVVAELLLRILGFTALYPYKVISDPPNCIVPSSQFGFQLNAGTFNITINDSLQYTATQAPGPLMSTRITSPTPRPIGSDSLIFLSGCSFTYGMGVDDNLTYPFRLQSRLPNYHIINGAAPAHGTLQTLLITKKLLEHNIHPRILIYNYIDFHKERNVLSRPFRQLLLEESQTDDKTKGQLRETGRFPYGELQEADGRLAIKHAKLNNRNLFYSLRSWSALANQLEYAYNHFAADNRQADAVTEAAILEIRELCKDNNINFIVAILKDTEPGPSMKGFCERNAIPAIDVSIDYTDPGYLNLPFDGHPNARAHSIFAEKVYRYLTEEKWVHRTVK